VIGLVDQRSVGWNFLCGHYQEAKTSSSPGAPGSASVGNSTCRRSERSSPGAGEKGQSECEKGRLKPYATAIRRSGVTTRQRQPAPQLGPVGGGFRTSASILD